MMRKKAVQLYEHVVQTGYKYEDGQEIYVLW